MGMLQLIVPLQVLTLNLTLLRSVGRRFAAARVFFASLNISWNSRKRALEERRLSLKFQSQLCRVARCQSGMGCSYSFVELLDVTVGWVAHTLMLSS